MKLTALTLSDLKQVRLWRNESLVSLRTSFPLTQEMQADFYANVVCNRSANARYWAIWGDVKIPYMQKTILPDGTKEFYPSEANQCCLIGMCGLENISWENRNAEISIIIDPDMTEKGYGAQAVDMLLEQGFNHLNLENIFGECYYCNPALLFWRKISEKYKAEEARLPYRKYWNGKYYDSLYFNINKGEFTKHENIIS